MSKEIDLVKCIISEIDTNLYSDFGGNPCISYTSNLKKLLLALDTPEVRHFFENYERQAERIAELEEQLKGCIRPKFKIGQEVWVVLDDGVAKDVVENNWFLCSLEKSRLGLYEDYLFATEEEARKRLEELNGE